MSNPDLEVAPPMAVTRWRQAVSSADTLRNVCVTEDAMLASPQVRRSIACLVDALK